MAKHLDLEEQEQLAQLKHFWRQYGNAITWVLIGVLGAFASWNLYQHWQRSQAEQAAALYDEVERVVKLADMAKMDRVFADMQERYGRTTYAHKTGLLVAKHYYQAGQIEAAKAALAWVVYKASDQGYKAIARLRLAAILMEAKVFDEALQQLSGSFPVNFKPLVADRKGDLFLLQGKSAEAIAAYRIAFQTFDQRSEYRRLVEIKLNSLGVDPQDGVKAGNGVAAPEGKK